MYITLLLITILVLSFICIYFQSKKQKVENYFQIEDDDDEIIFDETMAENVQPTYDQIMAKKQLRKQLELEKEKALQLAKQLQQIDSGYTPDYSGSTNCKSRCDCCWKNSQSSDRIEACNKKYKSGSQELNECLYSNSKYAHNACKSKFGKGLIFKTC